jgi:hypothetical protein
VFPPQTDNFQKHIKFKSDLGNEFLGKKGEKLSVGFVLRDEPPHREGGRRVGFGHGDFAGRSFARGQYEYGVTIAALGPRGATGHGLPFVVHVALKGGVWVFHLGEIGWVLPTPRLSKWRGTGLIHLVLTPVHSLFLTLAHVFYFAGGRHGGLLVDRLRLPSTHDRRSKVILQPHPDDDQGVHHFWG